MNQTEIIKQRDPDFWPEKVNISYKAEMNKRKRITCNKCGKEVGVYEVDGWFELILKANQLVQNSNFGPGIEFRMAKSPKAGGIFCSEKCMLEYLIQKVEGISLGADDNQNINGNVNIGGKL